MDQFWWEALCGSGVEGIATPPFSSPHPPTHYPTKRTHYHLPTYLVGEVLERADGDGLLGGVARGAVVLRLVGHHHLLFVYIYVCGEFGYIEVCKLDGFVCRLCKRMGGWVKVGQGERDG